RSLDRATLWPRCRSREVGSTPSLTRSFRPEPSFLASSSSLTSETVPRFKRANCFSISIDRIITFSTFFAKRRVTFSGGQSYLTLSAKNQRGNKAHEQDDPVGDERG